VFGANGLGRAVLFFKGPHLRGEIRIGRHAHGQLDQIVAEPVAVFAQVGQLFLPTFDVLSVAVVARLQRGVAGQKFGDLLRAAGLLVQRIDILLVALDFAFQHLPLALVGEFFTRLDQRDVQPSHVAPQLVNADHRHVVVVLHLMGAQLGVAAFDDEVHALDRRQHRLELFVIEIGHQHQQVAFLAQQRRVLRGSRHRIGDDDLRGPRQFFQPDFSLIADQPEQSHAQPAAFEHQRRLPQGFVGRRVQHVRAQDRDVHDLRGLLERRDAQRVIARTEQHGVVTRAPIGRGD